MLQHIHARSALLPTGWAHDVRIAWRDGTLLDVAPALHREPGDEVHDIILPGMANLHSHAFQRAMAGLAEKRGSGTDSFWSWRNLMYDFALQMTPDDIEAVAAQLYMEMLEQGFTRVGEFHYLHHDKDGQPYADIAEHASRIAAASAESGIGLTLLPVFYAHAGFGGQSPSVAQRRFISGLQQFEKMLAASEAALAKLPGANIGVAPHSLRAVTLAELKVLVELAGGRPVHIHIAEQTKEVDDCIAWCGSSPVSWLMENSPVSHNWCLIHATHMTEMETQNVAQSGAVVGLCPITEANLGDGIFPASTHMLAGGQFGIGSDSNIQISLPGELRQLEYSQRLQSRTRNILAEPNASNGQHLFNQALHGGAKALGTPSGIACGLSADLVSLNRSTLPSLDINSALDFWIFSEGYKIDCVWSLGQKQVKDGQHVRRECINVRFLKTMEKLLRNRC